MKKIFYYLGIFLIILSCQKEKTGPASIEFQVTFPTNNLKNGVISDSIYAAIITIEDQSGVKKYDSEKIELYNMNGYFLSKPVTITSGSYNLTQFIIVDKNNKVLYATPLEGSSKAYLVSKPLPISINVAKDEVKKIEPEVISTELASPGDFGYSTFGVKIIEPINFLFTAFEYQPDIKNYALISGNLKIIAADIVLYDKSFDAKTNLIQIPNNYDSYKLITSKLGYRNDTTVFSKDSLKKSFDFPVKVILNTGLVGYFPFSGNAKDMSGSNLKDSVYGESSFTMDRLGKLNNAFQLNGYDNYIRIKDDPKLSFSNEYSICLWYKNNQDFIGCGWNPLIMKGYTSHTSPYYEFIVAIGGNYISPSGPSYPHNFGFATNVNNTVYQTYTGSNSWQVNGDWHFVVSVYNGSKAQLYIDNVLKSETNCPGVTTNYKQDIFIGRQANMECYTPGIIDDIRLYNRAISLDEMNYIKNL